MYPPCLRQAHHKPGLIKYQTDHRSDRMPSRPVLNQFPLRINTADSLTCPKNAKALALPGPFFSLSSPLLCNAACRALGVLCSRRTSGLESVPRPGGPAFTRKALLSDRISSLCPVSCSFSLISAAFIASTKWRCESGGGAS